MCHGPTSAHLAHLQCGLQPEEHQVRKDLWEEHKQDYKAFVDASLANATASAVLLDNVADDDAPAVGGVELAGEALKSLAAVISERTTRPKQPTRQQQSDALLTDILKGVEVAITSFQSLQQDVELQQKTANEASSEVTLATESLKPFKDSPEKLLVVQRLSELERLVEDLRATLPEDTGPLFYDSGKNPSLQLCSHY
jgi:hypothetical protein